MAERVTIRNLERTLQPFAKTMGLRIATAYNDVGGIMLDGAYGGYAIALIVGEGGGVTYLLRDGHVPARELQQAMFDAMEGVEIYERVKREGA